MKCFVRVPSRDHSRRHVRNEHDVIVVVKPCRFDHYQHAGEGDILNSVSETGSEFFEWRIASEHAGTVRIDEVAT